MDFDNVIALTFDDDMRQYLINANRDTGTYDANVMIDNNICDTKSEEIARIGDVVCGYRLFIDEAGLYGYINEDDLEILPYRFDLATNFNEYGLALVAYSGTVSWINKDFKIFSSDDECFINIEDNSYILGFKEVYNFNGNKNPLSKIVTFDEQVLYLNTEGEIQKFRYKNESNISSWDKEYFLEDGLGEFNKEGFMISKDGNTVLSEDGYIYTGEDARNIWSRKYTKNIEKR